MEQRNFAKHLRHRMTGSEIRLWRHLRAHRLYGEKFRRQQPIGPYVLDFVHFGARLIVKADGGRHNEAAHDQKRDAWLRAQGFKVLRFWNNFQCGSFPVFSLLLLFRATASPIRESGVFTYPPVLISGTTSFAGLQQK